MRAGHGIGPHLIRGFFIGAVVFGGIIILSLLNAVFVDEMSADIAERQEDELQQLADELKRLRRDMVERLDRLESSGRVDNGDN